MFFGLHLAKEMETPLENWTWNPEGLGCHIAGRAPGQNEKGRGQEIALATIILLKVDYPPLLGGVASPRTSFSPQGTLNPTTPIHLQPPQDGLNQAAGQMDKLDAKVGVGPEASRRPGRESQGSLGTNRHIDSHTSQEM
jgi:hypothetical protein